MNRIVPGLTALIAALVLISPVPALAAAAAMPSDFNGDGYADLAIGAAGEEIHGHPDAGAVNVLYGSATGLTAAGNQLWSQDTPGVKGVSQGTSSGGDRFGSVVASGDFDADGFADLAIGVPRDRVGTQAIKAGSVNVLYGSGGGLTAAGNQRWSQVNLPGDPTWYDWFGGTLATGDFDGDGYEDLAIGARYDLIGDLAQAGSVTVLHGGPDGLTASGALVLTLASVPASPESDAAFGRACAAGDLDGDGYADLAIGSAAGGGDGEIAVFYGADGGLGNGPTELWSQDSPGIADGEAPGIFGASIAIADFDDDGFADLAAGVPGEGQAGAAEGRGALEVIYGSPDGLTALGNELWFPPDGWLPSDDDYGPAFGSTIVAGDFDGDGTADLAAGGPYTGLRWGVVVAVPGGVDGLAFDDAQLWTQDTAGVPGTTENGDRFGEALGSGDFGRSGKDDLAIGAPGERLAHGKAGRVTVLYGSSAGLSVSNAQVWTQDASGVAGHAESGDYFGGGLSSSTPGGEQ